MAYQSFDGEKGDSDSAAKLKCLGLPDDLTGKTVLDIGCNEGYFVREALRRGAKLAVGIDLNGDLIEKAKKRVPDGHFYPISWWELGANKFDYILFLSAIHYEPKQRKLLTKLSYNLNPAGTLILECGVDIGNNANEWVLVQRHDDLFRFPSFGYLENTLLDRYTTRVIGDSVQQSGDPLRRYVLHCTPIEPRILIVTGYSRSGKTAFSQMLAREGTRVVSSDVALTNALQQLPNSKDPFVQYVAGNMNLGQIDLFVKKMIEDGNAEAFCRFMLRLISHDDDLTILEGFPFVSETVLATFKRVAEGEGYRVATTRLEGGVKTFDMA